MDKDAGSGTIGGENLREKARELAARHGEHAGDYARARVEASRTAGEDADAEAWERVLQLLG